MKEDDIRRADLLEECDKYYLEDMAKLAGRGKEFVSVNCPACDSAIYAKEFDKFGFNFDKCAKCRTIFVNPRPTVEILNDYYENAVYYEIWAKKIFPQSEAARRKLLFAPRVDRIFSLCKDHKIPTDTLVEVGAGFGTFCQELESREAFKRVIAIEPTPELAAKCKSRGLEVINSGIEDVTLEDESVDVVASFEVIEHLFAPIDFIQKCSRILKKRGILVLCCPNGAGFDLATLGKKAQTFDGEHINYFNPSSLGILLYRCGFDVIETKTPGKLDAELVRKKVLAKEYDISAQPFLQEVLIDRWEEVGEAFQNFLAENMLSSHMWIVGKKSGN